MNGTCQNCGQHVHSLKIETVPAYTSTAEEHHGAVFLCPSCSAVLGAGLDPAALGGDLVNRVVAEVARILKR